MDWPTEKFGEVCEFVRGPFGGALKKNIFKESGYAVYEQQHAINDQFESIRYFIDEDKFLEMSRFELLPGDLIMSCSGTMGKIAIAPPSIPRGIINQALLKLSPSEVLDAKFLKLWMESRDFQKQIESLSQGVAIKNMASVKILKEIKVPTPSIAEQKRIVAILDQAFADIDKARALTEQNLKNARELFESYLQQVFSQRGEGWKEEKMSEVCEGKITDGTHQTPKYFEEGYIFLSSKNVTSGVIDWENIKYIDEAQHVEMQKRLSPRLNDILLAKNGTTGVAAIVDKEEIFDIYVSLALLRPSEKIEPRYLLHYVNSSVAKAQFNMRLKGIGVPNLHLKEIRDVLVSYPVSREEQKRILKQIDDLLKYRNTLEGIYQAKLMAIDELKKSILQKAFSGELTKDSEEAAA